MLPVVFFGFDLRVLACVKAAVKVLFGAAVRHHDELPLLLDLRQFFIVELGVRDLMDSGGNRLHLAHALTDGDALFVRGKIAVHVCRHLLKSQRHRRGAFQRLHENLIILDVALQIRSKHRQGLSVRLAHIKDGHDLIHGDFDLFFLHDSVTVRVQQRRFRVRVELCFLDFLFEWRRCNDLDAFFALHDIAGKLIVPLVEARDQRCVGLLHIDEHGVVDAVLVEPAHGAQVLSVLVGLEQLLDAGFDALGDFLQPVFGRSLFRHNFISFPGLNIPKGSSSRAGRLNLCGSIVSIGEQVICS